MHSRLQDIVHYTAAGGFAKAHAFLAKMGFLSCVDSWVGFQIYNWSIRTIKMLITVLPGFSRTLVQTCSHSGVQSSAIFCKTTL